MNNSFIIKGDFYFSSKERKLLNYNNSYCVVENGISQGIFKEIPEKYMNLQVIDHSGNMIMPGLVDLHLHASQYSFRGMGMDLELLQWLNEYTFPEEHNYADEEYADRAYQIFTDDLKRSYSTRAVVFGTIHTDTTLMLMEKLEKAGLYSYVGKVNMDRNAPDYYIEEAKDSITETKRFIEEALRRFKKTKPIITPRFIPTCTDTLMKGLAEIQKETQLPVQSHLSENRSEIEWVKELCPEAEFYGDAYDRFGLFGKGCKTIMAHCVSSTEMELERMRTNGVYVAHCPNSNMNLSSGIAPVRRLLDKGIHVGIGTDIAGGHTLSMLDEMVSAVQASKMRWRYIDEEEPITIIDAFYMATRGGGSFFGNIGGFDGGYEFDAIVIDDSTAATSKELDSVSRFVRVLNLGGECRIKEKYVGGDKII